LASGGKLFVADYSNNRVLAWNSLPSSMDAPANFVLGQGSFGTNASGSGAAGIYHPIGLASDGNRLAVSDESDNRVLIWNSLSLINGQPADVVLGQTNFSTTTANPGGVSASTLYNPYHISYGGGKLLVADPSNNRVLIWNGIPASNAAPADMVLGQAAFSGSVANSPALNGSSMYSPLGVATDGTRLAVADYANHRVLLWNSFPTMNGQAADMVLGQPNLFSNVANNGGLSAASLNSPYDVAFLSGQLAVADTGNNRILYWNSWPLSNKQAADRVLGQPDMVNGNGYGLSEKKLNWPVMLSEIGGKTLVADSNNNRVAVFDCLAVPTPSPTVLIPTPVCTLTTFEAANYALGQSSLLGGTANQGGLPSATTLYNPYAALPAGGKFFVADLSNNRVLGWNSLPASMDAPAKFVLGQGGFGTAASGSGAAGMNQPLGLASDGNRLAVSDEANNRILIWNSLSLINGQPADVVLGQTNFSTTAANSGGLSAATLYNPYHISYGGGKLLASDPSNNRVLIWNGIPYTNGASADLVLGQANFGVNSANSPMLNASSMYSPLGVATDGTHLAVADYANHRVLLWNSFPTVNGQAADLVLGQPNLYSNAANNGGLSAASLNSPYDVAFLSGQLAVADTGNNRILYWNSWPLSNKQAADRVIGQSGFASSAASLSAAGLSAPVMLSESYGKTFISDKGNNRILAMDCGPTPTATPSALGTFTNSPTPSPSASVTATPTATRSPTQSLTATPSPSRSASPTLSLTATASSSPLGSATETPSQTQSWTAGPSSSPTPVATPTASPSDSPTSSPSASPSGSPTASSTASGTASNSPSRTPSSTASPTPTNTPLPIWSNGGGDHLWSNGANWATGSVPANLAIFSGLTDAACSMDVNPLGVALQIGAAYAGSITQGLTAHLASFSQAGGTYSQGGNILILDGDLNLSGGAFSKGSGKLVGNGAISVSGGSFGGGSGDISVQSLSLSGGNFTSSSSSLTLTAGGNSISIAAGTFLANGGSVVLQSGGGPAYVNAPGVLFNNIAFLNSYSAQLNSDLAVAGNFLFQSPTGNPFYQNGHSLSVGGDLQVRGTGAFAGGPVLLNGAAGQNFNFNSGDPSSSLSSLTVNKASGSVTLLNNFSRLNGPLDIQAGALDFNGYSLGLSGNFSNSGSAGLGSGTLNLNGLNPVISGISIFNNLNMSVSSTGSLTFPSGLTQTVTGTLTLQGLSGGLLALRASSPGSACFIDPQSGRFLNYLDVQDSDNINAAAAVAGGSADSGNNSNWVFVPPYTPSVTASPSRTPSPSPSFSFSPTPSPSPTATRSPTASPTASPSPTPPPAGSSPTITPSISPSFSASPTASPTASLTASPSATPPCPAVYGFEDGSDMGWFALQAFGNPVNDGSRVFCGDHALRMDVDASGSNLSGISQAFISNTDFTGRSLSLHYYLSGPALPAGTRFALLVFDNLNGTIYHFNTSAILLGQWNSALYKFYAADNATSVYSVGFQLVLPAGSNWSGQIWADEVDISAPDNYTPTFTPTFTPSPSPTPSPAPTNVDVAEGHSLSYPSPASDHVCFAYQSPEGGQVSILIYTLAFQLAAKVEDQALGGRPQSTCVDIGGLGTGAYFYALKVGNYSFPLNKLKVVK
jgi:hypothetical protein